MKRTSFEISKELSRREDAILGENQTGYPHLDKRHLKYYSVDDIAFGDLPDISMYGMVLNTALKNRDSIAILYYGRKINYNEFIYHIDEYALAFQKMGVTKGEIVTIISPNLPEVFYSIYALNKLGAIASLIDPRNGVDRINYHLSESKSKRIIMMDILYPKLKELIKEKEIKEVYTITASDSLPLGLNYIQKAKTIVENQRKNLPNCPKNDIYKSLRKYVLDNVKEVPKKDPYQVINSERGKGEDVAIIVNTSGTTAAPKGVMLTNTNLNAVAYDYKYCGMDYSVGDGFLGIMPCFVAYGIGVGTHMPFVLGLKNIVIPAMKPEEFGKLIVKYHANHFAGVPMHYQIMMESKDMKGKDLSFIKTAASGGDVFDPKLKAKTNEFLANHNCPNKLKVGYGSTENTGVAASQFYIGESNIENELTTVGIPAFYTEIKVENPETHEALKFNEVGEIILSGKGVMKGYFNNPELTKEAIEETEEGRFLHTGDLGYIDENGCLYIHGRIKRLIIAPDGHKIFPNFIEEVVLRHELVDACVCVGLKDESYETGKAPVAFIKIKKGYEDRVEQIIEELKYLSLDKLPERDIALDYIVIDEIPMTENGKINYTYLENNYIYNSVSLSRKKN